VIKVFSKSAKKGNIFPVIVIIFIVIVVIGISIAIKLSVSATTDSISSEADILMARPDLTLYVENVRQFHESEIEVIGYASYERYVVGAQVLYGYMLTDSFGNEIKLEKVPKDFMPVIRDKRELVNVTGIFYSYSDRDQTPKIDVISIRKI
jgi:hypothetical protein